MSREFEERGGIRLQGMRFWGTHGVTADERLHPQPIDVDVDLDVAFSDAIKNDDLAGTLDYTECFRICEDAIVNHSFQLLETLAHHIMDQLWKFKQVRGATVRVRKPRFLSGATPEIELQRTR